MRNFHRLYTLLSTSVEISQITVTPILLPSNQEDMYFLYFLGFVSDISVELYHTIKLIFSANSQREIRDASLFSQPCFPSSGSFYQTYIRGLLQRWEWFMWFVLICVPLGGTAEDIFSRKMFACWKSVHESLTEPCALAVSRRTCQCNILRETITTVPSLAPNPSRVIHLRNGSELPAALNSTARHITNW